MPGLPGLLLGRAVPVQSARLTGRVRRGAEAFARQRDSLAQTSAAIRSPVAIAKSQDRMRQVRRRGCIAATVVTPCREALHGLHGVQLVISDAHAELVEAIGATLPGASWQRSFANINAGGMVPLVHLRRRERTLAA